MLGGPSQVQPNGGEMSRDSLPGSCRLLFWRGWRGDWLLIYWPIAPQAPFSPSACGGSLLALAGALKAGRSQWSFDTVLGISFEFRRLWNHHECGCRRSKVTCLSTNPIFCHLDSFQAEWSLCTFQRPQNSGCPLSTRTVAFNATGWLPPEYSRWLLVQLTC